VAARRAGTVDDISGQRADSNMRYLFAIALFGIVGLPSLAEARDYPVCLRVYENYRDFYDECAYTSIPQCQMSASGRSAQCLENPFYVGPAPRARPRHHRHRRHR
jgi:hypothetical protein